MNDQYFISVARAIAQVSGEHDKDACIVVKDKAIVSQGTRGNRTRTGNYSLFVARRDPEVREESSSSDNDWSVITAVEDAITCAASRGVSLAGGIAYTLLAPRARDVLLLSASGVKTILHDEQTKVGVDERIPLVMSRVRVESVK